MKQCKRELETCAQVFAIDAVGAIDPLYEFHVTDIAVEYARSASLRSIDASTVPVPS